MAPQPILATHRISIQYVPYTLTHNMNLFVDAVPTALGDASGFDAVSHILANPNVGMSALVSTILTLMQPCIRNAGTFTSWTLYHRVAPNYIPVYSTVIGANGTAGTTTKGLTAQFTSSFRTGLYEKAQVILLEPEMVAPQHGPLSGSDAFDLFGLGFVDRAAGKPGNFITGRDDTVFATAKYRTVSLNKKLRRELGLV